MLVESLIAVVISPIERRGLYWWQLGLCSLLYLVAAWYQVAGLAAIYLAWILFAACRLAYRPALDRANAREGSGA